MLLFGIVFMEKNAKKKKENAAVRKIFYLISLQQELEPMLEFKVPASNCHA